MAYFRGGRGGSKRVNSQILGQKGGFLGGFGGQKVGFLAFFGFFRPFLLGYTLKRGSKRGGGGGFWAKMGQKGGGGGVLGPKGGVGGGGPPQNMV